MPLVAAIAGRLGDACWRGIDVADEEADQSELKKKGGLKTAANHPGD
jgi:hypothetical protein